MNPLDKKSLMTPAAYTFLAMPLLIPFCKWRWGNDADWFLYTWFVTTFIVAALWNYLYLWKEDDQ